MYPPPPILHVLVLGWKEPGTTLLHRDQEASKSEMNQADSPDLLGPDPTFSHRGVAGE